MFVLRHVKPVQPNVANIMISTARNVQLPAATVLRNAGRWLFKDFATSGHIVIHRIDGRFIVPPLKT